MEWLLTFTKENPNAVIVLIPSTVGLIALLWYTIHMENYRNSAKQMNIPPSFWSLRENHIVDTLKRFKLSDDKSNYVEIEKLNTKDSWGKYIEIKRKYFRTTIVPKEKSEILALVIKRNPSENWKTIHFNM